MPTKRRTLPTLPVAAGGAARIEEEPRLPAEAEAARIKADDDGDNDDDDGGNASSTSSDPYTCDDETGERILKPGRTALIDAEAEETRSQRKMETWTELEVIAWLTEQSFEGLVIQNFANERIGGKVLSTLKTEELEQLGVTSPLHQKKVCSAIKKERARLQRVAERHLVEAWSAKDVQKWLERNKFAGLEISQFRDINGAVLVQLYHDDLQTLGIGTSLHRNVFRAAIDELIDAVAAAQQDPERMCKLQQLEEEKAAAEAELARLSRLDAETAQYRQDLADAKATGKATAAALEKLKAEHAAALQAAQYGVQAIAKIDLKSIQFTEPPRTLGGGATAKVMLGTITIAKHARDVALKVFHGSEDMQLSDALRQQIEKEVEVRRKGQNLQYARIYVPMMFVITGIMYKCE